MLIINLTGIFSARGITSPATYLRKNGFSYDTARSLSTSQMFRPSLSVIERLCVLLNCTPNDILEWIPEKDKSYGEDFALNSLKREKKQYNLLKMIKNIPLDKIDEIEKIVSGIKK